MLARFLKSKTAVAFAGGLSAGLALGLAVAVGVVIGLGQRSGDVRLTLAERLVGETALEASGATTGKAIAIATGPVGEGAEGVFILDYLTGELQCWVLNPRAGRFMNAFKYNVINDLGVEQGKTPDYVMAPGEVEFRGQVNYARSVIYVADGNTGNVACYAVPWSRTAETAGQPQVGVLERVAVGKARMVAIQE